jgi:hypothetical protein
MASELIGRIIGEALANGLFKAMGGRKDARTQGSSFIGKVVLWTAAIASLLIIFWLAVTFSIPAEPGFSASLLQQPYCIVPLLVIAVGMVAVMLISAVLSSSLRSDAPVFCAAMACAAISWRGGTMQATLFAASGPGIFVSLALESIILFAALIGAWQLLQKLRGKHQLKTTASDEDAEEERLDEKLLAVFTQASAMMAIMILLCRSDSKDQCLASVGVSAAAGAAIATQLVTVRSSFWLWIGPLAVALFGYLFASFHADGWQVGLLHGPLAALARPLPLDYVSMGPAGAIFGYWLSGSGIAEEELDPDAGTSQAQS